MQNQRQDQIRERAYQIWEREGRQHGRAEEHWWQAEQELVEPADAAPTEGNGAGAVDAEPTTPNGAAKTAAKPRAQRKRRGAQAAPQA